MDTYSEAEDHLIHFQFGPLSWHHKVLTIVLQAFEGLLLSHIDLFFTSLMCSSLHHFS